MGERETFSTPLTPTERVEVWMAGVRGSQASQHLVIIQAVEEEGRPVAVPREPSSLTCYTLGRGRECLRHVLIDGEGLEGP